MKTLIFALVMSVSAVACAKEEPKKEQPAAAVAQENNNCVKKDKNGKCPPLPKSAKPTPKKPITK